MGFEVEEETNSEGGLRRVQEDPHRVIILHTTTPSLSADKLLVALREITESPMVVIGKGGETAMVGALIQGADVYLEQPVKMRELAARIRALVRRYERTNGAEGCLRALEDGGQMNKVFEKLSQTEAKLLRFLLERDGRLTAREELMTEVWGSGDKETSLRFYIWQLRRKLSGVGRIEIMNMKGMGYLLKVRQTGSSTG
jgi:DNA-binding response OmpR family regulator